MGQIKNNGKVLKLYRSTLNHLLFLTMFKRSMSYWRGEAKGAVSASGNEVSVTAGPKGDGKVNAMWKEGPGLSPATPAAQYFEIEVLQGEDPSGALWVGFTDEAHFGVNYASKGFMFGGNLSDGGRLLRQAFGPRLHTGDKVGLYGRLVPQPNKRHTLQIMFTVNGHGLGLGFSLIEFEVCGIGPLYPVVSFTSVPGKVRIARTSAPDASALEKSAGGARTSELGDWVANAKDIDPQCEALDQVRFSLRAERGTWRLGAKVANQISTELSPDVPHPVKAAGRPAMTMMMPPPSLQTLENNVKEIVGSVKSLALQEDGTLKLDHGNGSLSLNAFDEVHKPVDGRELTWIAEDGKLDPEVQKI